MVTAIVLINVEHGHFDRIAQQMVALDGITEEGVMDAVHELSRKKTIIIIAHRLTTVRDCDDICLLDHGSIVRRGSYDDLRRESTWFRAAVGD